MLNEAARCLAENVIRSPRDGDVGAVFGFGFPPFRGGPFRYADAVGAAKLVEKAAKFASLGKLYEPTKQMRRLAETGAKFHDTEKSAKPAAETLELAGAGKTR
jgi:3-hydroxyacyl-CoA dehydrogenase/enoyl-CoA hydratase/3-hydroxybutyryl-CoA epimerase